MEVDTRHRISQENNAPKILQEFLERKITKIQDGLHSIILINF